MQNYHFSLTFSFKQLSTKTILLEATLKFMKFVNFYTQELLCVHILSYILCRVYTVHIFKSRLNEKKVSIT